MAVVALNPIGTAIERFNRTWFYFLVHFFLIYSEGVKSIHEKMLFCKSEIFLWGKVRQLRGNFRKIFCQVRFECWWSQSLSCLSFNQSNLPTLSLPLPLPFTPSTPPPDTPHASPTRLTPSWPLSPLLTPSTSQARLSPQLAQGFEAFPSAKDFPPSASAKRQTPGFSWKNELQGKRFEPLAANIGDPGIRHY